MYSPLIVHTYEHSYYHRYCYAQRIQQAHHICMYIGMNLINSFVAWKSLYAGEQRYRDLVLPRAYRSCLQLLKRNRMLSRLNEIRNCRSEVYFKLKVYRKVLKLMRRQATRSIHMETKYYAVRYVCIYLYVYVQP